MTSFIIAATDGAQAEALALELCGKYDIDRFDITFVSPEEKKETTAVSLGIDVVKKMREKVSYKPLRGSWKAVILRKAHLLTLPAQNALLKLLEEPPSQTLIFLLSTRADVFLPTILSRCSLISCKEPEREVSYEEKAAIQTFFVSLSSKNKGELLKKAQDLTKQKETAVDFLQTMIIVAREMLIERLKREEEIGSLPRQIEILQQAHQTLNTTTINPRLTVEHALLCLSSD